MLFGLSQGPERAQRSEESERIAAVEAGQGDGL